MDERKLIKQWKTRGGRYGIKLYLDIPHEDDWYSVEYLEHNRQRGSAHRPGPLKDVLNYVGDQIWDASVIDGKTYRLC